MNVGRGLFRAWIFVSVLWLCGIGLIAYTEMPRQISSPIWGYVHIVRKEIDMNKADWKRPYYDNMRSPSAEKLPVEFHKVEYEHVASWNDDVRAGKMTVLDEPDGSHLYLSTEMRKQDQNYLSEAFWNQRWSRWIEASKYWMLGILGPPVMLLIIGWGLFWVGRGFKTGKA
jgi:hypothetical protein